MPEKYLQLELAQSSTQAHSININLSGTANIFGDRERIGQVITNLISNAIKYSSCANNIIVRSDSDAEHLTLDIEDFGVADGRVIATN